MSSKGAILDQQNEQHNYIRRLENVYGNWGAWLAKYSHSLVDK